MIDLESLGLTNPSITISFRGSPLLLHPISAAEERVIREVFPSPNRVQVPDGRGGMRTDPNEPRQQEAERWRNLQCMAATLLVASGTNKTADREALTKATENLLAVASAQEIAAAWDTLMAAAAVTRDQAEKN